MSENFKFHTSLVCFCLLRLGLFLLSSFLYFLINPGKKKKVTFKVCEQSRLSPTLPPLSWLRRDQILPKT